MRINLSKIGKNTFAWNWTKFLILTRCL